ncbi:hypothetical protein K435DRAFT_844759 [Dendrothele bispora CBS 962.96]|uniref:ribonuclease H n=1 Tax=Dendrothele bispora (strain CBS 962.96) TaxID=1314807 RepID=A0A4S8KZ81_DENBC|nr:hypothetical protein K435DRAFT_844759 [Dendrothele bispora CBS 962.96]
MPIWHQMEADPSRKQLSHTLASKCLKMKHNVRTVGDAEELAKNLEEEEHELQNNCKCQICNRLKQTTSCTHPHSCMKQAAKLLDTLPQKWDPRADFPEEYQKEIRNHDPNWKPFDNRITTTGELKDVFRIFTNKKITPTNTLPNLRTEHTQDNRHIVTREVIVATDGSCLNNGNDNARAGAGMYSNQTGELVATKLAAELANPDVELKIETDSKYVIQMLTTKKNQMEDDGYIGVSNGALIRSTIASLRGRKGKTLFKWVKGQEQNKKATEMARKALERNKASPIHLSVTPTLLVTGAKLSTMTQALAYKAVTQWKTTVAARQRTNRNILNIKDTTQQHFDYIPTEEKSGNQSDTKT